MEGSSQVDDVSGWVWRGLALLLMSLLGWTTMEAVSWLWLAPRRMERLLRAQGIPGNPYRLLLGDILEDLKLAEEAKLKPFPAFSHDITARVLPSIHKALATHGKFCFTWLGTHARVNIADPVLIREVLSNKSGHFRKPEPTPILRFILTGLVTHEGEKWATHRRIVNPAFHVEKLKRMSATFYDCCTELVGRWERLLGPEGSCEIDAQIELQNLTKDIISRTAFGSSFEKGRRIFELLEEQTELAARLFMYWQIPAYRYIPTKKNRRMKEVYREVHEILRNMILERQKAVRSGVASNDDLLGLLLESNLSYSSEKGELKRSGMTTERGFGMTTEDMIEECKLFYFAGQETTSDLLTWTMVALSMHPEWQERARAEVLQVFGKNRPEYDGLSQLTTVTMILYEVLRLYPPSVLLTRNADGAVTLGGYNFPSGTQFVIHVLFPHHDPELWGSDANEFKPERFAEGVSGASKGPVTAFLPFGGGARICVGQSFALMEARMCLCAILQNFSFELSPAYKHAPHLVITLHAQHGVQIVLRKL